MYGTNRAEKINPFHKICGAAGLKKEVENVRKLSNIRKWDTLKWLSAPRVICGVISIRKS